MVGGVGWLFARGCGGVVYGLCVLRVLRVCAGLCIRWCYVWYFGVLALNLWFRRCFLGGWFCGGFVWWCYC